jgi:hypothetical protein
MHNQPVHSESHSGELKQTEHQAVEFFEVGGQKLHLHGTSGPPKERSRTAEGKPVRHAVFLADRTIPLETTSCASEVGLRVGAGQPVQHRPSPQNAISGMTGSGQLIGGPIRRV